MGEKYMGEKSVEKECLGEEREESLGEKYICEKSVAKESVGEKSAGDRSVSEKCG